LTNLRQERANKTTIIAAQRLSSVMHAEEIIAPTVNEKLIAHEVEANRHHLHDDLTTREREVLQLIAAGKSNQEIADELFITLKTVKTHVSNILSKLGVEDRTQATIYAFQNQLVK